MEKAAANDQQPKLVKPASGVTPSTRKSTNGSERKKKDQLPVAPKGETIDLNAPELFLNRELTWLEFSRRVLHMAADPQTPLLERVKFIAIVSNNLDEFFMKRIGGLKQQIAAGIRTPTIDGRTPLEQVTECQAAVRELHKEQNQVYRELHDLLLEQGITLANYTDLKQHEQATLRSHFVANIFPLLTPLAMDPGHPFPFISNLTLNLLVSLRYPGGSSNHLARLKVPVSKDIAPRFLKVGDENTFVALNDVLTNNLDLLFPGMEIVSCELFRVTRNA
ncbi:MAG: hypothetical protein ACR2PS_10625, partial [Pseudomonadales bacterium]